MSELQPTRFEHATGALCKAVLWVTMTVIFVILCGNTLLRYTTGSSLQWAGELPELLFPWLVMAGVVLAALHGSHIATTFLLDAAAPPARRIVGTASWLVVAALYITLTLATFGMLGIVADERSPILQVPGSVTYGCMTGGMALLAVLALLSAWRCAWSPTGVAVPPSEAVGAPAAQG